eukprot:2498031-Rhodomonas_salina.1
MSDAMLAAYRVAWLGRREKGGVAASKANDVEGAGGRKGSEEEHQSLPCAFHLSLSGVVSTEPHGAGPVNDENNLPWNIAELDFREECHQTCERTVLGNLHARPRLMRGFLFAKDDQVCVHRHILRKNNLPSFPVEACCKRMWVRRRGKLLDVRLCVELDANIKPNARSES